MFTRIFHAWERRLVSVTKDRIVRPFEWGLEWIPRHECLPRCPPLSVMTAWASAALAKSPDLFEAPPTTTYRLDDAVLSFQSALATPHPENNIVYARYFEASPRDRSAGRRAVIVLSQWNADPGSHMALSRILARVGVSALRLSLPYHDRRMPPELHRADYIVSANVGRTLQHAARRYSTRAGLRPGWPAELRSDRRPGNKPRLVPGDSHPRARTAHHGCGPEPYLAVLRRCRLARLVDCARPSRPRGTHLAR